MENNRNIKIGIATGLSSSIFYIGCFTFMKIVGLEGTVKLSNLLFHGMDFSNILRTNIPFTESLIGLIATFFFWGSMGYITSSIYYLINKSLLL